VNPARPGGHAARQGHPRGPLLPVLPARLELPDLPRAVCKGDPGPWFPGPGRGAGRDALELCAWCPERAPCLAWALDKGEPLGIWGGTTPDERKVILRAKGTGAVA
jgi:WhiB family redox-sensing transcriptional regulator